MMLGCQTPLLRSFCEVIQKALAAFFGKKPLPGQPTRSLSPLTGPSLQSPAEPTIEPLQTQVRREPVFVFQMGRVGSCSVRDSIKEAYDALSIPISIYHTHWQNDFDKLEAIARKDHADPTLLLKDLQDAKEIRRKLVDEATAPCNLISLVRDPVARNLSTYFYALPEFIPDWQQRMQDDALLAQYLQADFAVPRAFHTTPARWFDEQLKPIFNIDVYATPFPREQGYKIYSSEKARLLVLRLEDLTQCASQAIGEFLGLPHFNLRNDNAGEALSAGSLYRRFKNELASPAYVEQMYATKYARHFYTSEELAAFAAKWTRKISLP